MVFAYNNLQPVEILLVEDSAGDAELTQNAFINARVPSRIRVVRTGNEAMDYLYRRGSYIEAARPDLILLDLNIPGKSGKEILASIKRDELLMDIPVIILSSSQSLQDNAVSKQLGAGAYIVKPTELQEFLQVVETVDSFWRSSAKAARPASMFGD
jgi:DNA-binding response OmpR family regulator